MKPLPTAISCVTAIAAPLFLVGCLAPKGHEWQVSRAELEQIRDATSWLQLPTNSYVRVPGSARADAVSLLLDRSSVQLDASQIPVFAPDFQSPPQPELKPYLVRGASFSERPSYTIVRFNAVTGQLLVEQATYDGEMFIPFERWIVQPTPLVVFLPRTPEHVYSHPVLGGDIIFRGKQNLDMR